MIIQMIIAALQLPARIDNPNLIELAGQSNAAGACSFNNVQGDLIGPLPGTHIFNTTSLAWETLQGDVNNGALSYGHQTDGSHAFGVELRLMKLLQAHYAVDQYLIKYALGGTGLAAGNGGGSGLDWSPETPAQLYEQSNTNHNSAITALSDNRPPKALIWIQGEQDAIYSGYSSAYESNLRNFIAKKRNDYNYHTLPVLIVRLGSGQSTGVYPYLSVVRAAQEAVAAEANNYLIDADGLTVTDGSHYDAAGYDTLANRIYDVLITL